MIGVVYRESTVIACCSWTTCLITLLLHGGEEFQWNVEHVLLWPHNTSLFPCVCIVMTWSRQLQRNFILVVVVLIVRTQTDEHSQLVIRKIGCILFKGIRMYEHLQTLVLTKIEGCILIDRFWLACSKIVYNHRECLFVLLNQLWLVRVLSTFNAWRYYIVYRSLIIVFFKAHSTHWHCTRITCRVGKVLLILTPLTTYKVEGSKAEYDRLCKTSEEHTHKADAGKVADITHTLLELL